MQTMKKFCYLTGQNLIHTFLGPKNTFSQKVGFTLQDDLISKTQPLAFYTSTSQLFFIAVFVDQSGKHSFTLQE